MQIHIHAQGLAPENAIPRHIRHQVIAALAHAEEHIHHVSLHLADVNGGKGGLDKQCHLVVQLRGLPDIVIHETRATVQDAIGRALKRAEHSLSRRLDRHRQVAGHPVRPEVELWRTA